MGANLFILPLEGNGLKALPEIGETFVSGVAFTNTVLEDFAIVFPTPI